jgi:hypothetical protein
MNRDTSPLSTILEHDLEHRHSPWFGSKPEHDGFGELTIAITDFFVMKELVTNSTRDIWRFTYECHVFFFFSFILLNVTRMMLLFL